MFNRSTEKLPMFDTSVFLYPLVFTQICTSHVDKNNHVVFRAKNIYFNLDFDINKN